jgi:hypothetical protein
MAIMWEPPPKSASLRPTLAELAWRRWLVNGVREQQIAKKDAAKSRNDGSDCATGPAREPAAVNG